MQLILAFAAALNGPSADSDGTSAEPAGNPGMWVTSADYPVAALRHVARDPSGRLIGANSFWDLRIGESGAPALLLGPLTFLRFFLRPRFGPAPWQPTNSGAAWSPTAAVRDPVRASS